MPTQHIVQGIRTTQGLGDAAPAMEITGASLDQGIVRYQVQTEGQDRTLEDQAESVLSFLHVTMGRVTTSPACQLHPGLGPCLSEGTMKGVERRLRAAVNPVSTAVTGWWCHSVLRHTLTGHGPATRPRRLPRRDLTQGPGSTPSAEQMATRRAAIDELLSRDDHDI